MKKSISLLLVVVVFIMSVVVSYAQLPDKYEYKVTLDSVKSSLSPMAYGNFNSIFWAKSAIINGRPIKIKKEETFIIPNLYTSVKVEGKYCGKVIYAGVTNGYKLYSGVANKITKHVKVTVNKQENLTIVNCGKNTIDLGTMFKNDRRSIDFTFTFTIVKVKIPTPTPSNSASPSPTPSNSVSPSPTASNSVSPSPVGSSTVSPTESGSTSGSVTPSDNKPEVSKNDEGTTSNLSYAVINFGSDSKDNGSDKSDNSDKSDKKVYNSSLPQTGESTNKLPLIGGLISLVGMGIFIFLKKS